MILKYKKLDPAAATPFFGSEGAACFDLHAIIPEGSRLLTNGSAVINTGLAFEVPEGHVMLLYGRSSLAYKYDVRLANSVGVIDSDYRGEVCAKLTNDSMAPYTVKHGDRIAQAMIVELPKYILEEVTELSDTARGTGGFGSTGK